MTFSAPAGKDLKCLYFLMEFPCGLLFLTKVLISNLVCNLVIVNIKIFMENIMLLVQIIPVAIRFDVCMRS